MPWTVPITTEDGTTYPVHFDGDSAPTQDEIEYAGHQLVASQEGKPSVLGSFARGAARSAVPAFLGGRLGGMAGAAAGGALEGALAGSEVPVVGNIVGGLVGAGLGMLGASKAQSAAADVINPSASNPFSTASEQADVQTNPWTTELGGLALFKPNPMTAVRAVRGIATSEGRQLFSQGYQIAKKAAELGGPAETRLARSAQALNIPFDQAQNAAKIFESTSNVAGNVGLGAGMGVAQGQDPEHVLMAAAQGALFNDHWLGGSEVHSPLAEAPQEAVNSHPKVEAVNQAASDMTLASATAEVLENTVKPIAEIKATEELSKPAEPASESEIPTQPENAPQIQEEVRPEPSAPQAEPELRPTIEPVQERQTVGESPEVPVEPPETTPEASEAEQASPEQPEPQNAPETAPEGKETPSGEPIGSRHEDTEAQRREFNLPEIVKDAPKEIKDSFERAKKTVETNPTAPHDLMDKLESQDIRPLTDEEQALLTHHTVTLTNALKEIHSTLDSAEATPEAKDAAQVRLQTVTDDLNRLHNLNYKAGSAWGRSGRWRQQLLNQDYSLEKLLQRRSKLLKRGLNEREVIETTKLADEHEKLAKDYEQKTKGKDVEGAERLMEHIKSQPSKTKVDKKVLDKKLNDFFSKLKKSEQPKPEEPKQIQTSTPISEGEGQNEVTTEHQKEAVQDLQKTRIGRTLLKDVVTVPDWQRAIAHSELRSFTNEEINLMKKGEGFYDPQSGKTVIIRENIVPREGETPVQAFKRVLVHERMGHEGMSWMRKDDAFNKAYLDAARLIPKEELDSLKKLYPHLSDPNKVDQLIGEWFARNVEKLDPNSVPDPRTVFGKMWQAVKDFLKRVFGNQTKLDQKVRDLAAAILRNPESMEGRGGQEGDIEVLHSKPQFVSPEQDKAYLDAVNRGDTEAAQKMVDEAAKKAGLIKIDRSKGDGAPSGYYEHTTEKLGNLKSTEGAVRLGNEGKLNDLVKSLKDVPPSEVEPLIVSELFDDEKGGVERDVYNGNHRLHVWNDYQVLPKDTEIPILGKVDDTGVTRDANGKVIPISERFNPESNDIRFSIPEEKQEPKKRRPYEENPLAEVPHSLLNDLAKFHIEEGAKDVHDLVSRMHQTLAEHAPDITESDVREAYSKYGKTIQPTNDELQKSANDMKGQMRLLEAKGDAMAGIVPAKTGAQREKPSAEYRELEKQVRDEMEKQNLKRQNPEEERATRLDRLKTSLNNRIEDLTKQISDLKEGKEVTNRQRTPVERDDAARELEKRVRELTEERDSLKGAPELTEEQWNKRQIAATKRINEELDRRIKEKDFEAKKKPSFEANQDLLKLREEKQALKEQLAEIPENKELIAKKALETVKQRLADRLVEADRRIKEHDVAPRAKKPPITDKDIELSQLKLARKKQEIQNLYRKDQEANRTSSQKFWDGVVKLKRMAVLSSIAVFQKLTGAAGVRSALIALEDLQGGILGKLLPKAVVEKALIEGRASLPAYAKAFGTAFTKGMKDAFDTLKYGKSDLDVLYGNPKGVDEAWTSWLGRLHGAVKAPVKRLAFEYAMGKQMENMRRASLTNPKIDPTDELTIAQMSARAYRYANAAIFMNDHKLVDAWKGFLSILEKGGGGYAGIARFLQTLLPIVKVPVNIAQEGLTHVFGLPTGLYKLGKAWKSGYDNLSHEEADIIVRQLKKGSLGAALMLMGFFNPSMFGGYFNRDEKKKPGEVKYGGVRIGGQDVPKGLMHAPAFEVLQMGATIRHVADLRLKHTTDKRGIPSGALAGMMGLISEVPFINESLKTSDLESAEGREKYLGDLAKSQIEPAALQQIAQWQDVDKTGAPVKREPRTFTEDLKTGIPGLRETVPAKKEKKKAF